MAVLATVRRLHVRVAGTVQGVGFRPFVFRLAGELGLAGWVRNDERGVELEIEGEGGAVTAFVSRLASDAPPLARVEGVEVQPRPPRGELGFLIEPSSGAHRDADAQVTADAASCPECVAELADPLDRRYRYPFINCTNCGPRFTIVVGVPYDRPLTTMARFQMCGACLAEYEDPLDRRFHAQPNACPQCGPRARLVIEGTRGERASADRLAWWDHDLDAVSRAALLLAGGAIVAVKGLGGYHLACRADSEQAVSRLRAGKHREDRPFALMVADLAGARRLVSLGLEEAELMEHPARPIVLAARAPDATLAKGVAPRSRELGVMLPYTPLHHLLLSDMAALGGDGLVMTSGNISEEPIAYDDDDALVRLAPIADAILTHDRPIHRRADDSVVRTVKCGGGRRTMMLRRSRGFVPASIALPLAARRQLLACGAQLKSTFCLARGERAWVGPHIGDLSNWETLRSFREGIAHLEGLFALSPELIAHDLHPDYLSSAYALEREGVELLAVQHHHAHLAAVLAEHGERGPAIGAIYDGNGYGTDGTAWGGELLLGGLAGFERVGHLSGVALPGGDMAAREPWRMACAWLAECTGDRTPTIPPALEHRVAAARWSAVAEMIGRGLASPATTSVGRLCDAVAAICGVSPVAAYEGQAAIELEALADAHEGAGYPMPFEHGQLDGRPTVTAVVADLAAGRPLGTVSARFHNGLADATSRACVQLAREAGVSLVALAGGVFQNRLLLERTAVAIEACGLRVITPEQLPPNDGAISFGQAAIAASADTAA